MRWLRMGIVATAACAIWAAPAAACQYPSAASGGSSAGGGPPSAGPNDPVTVTISNVDEGGRWEVYVDGGRVMADVGDGSRSVSRTFDMPDLGGDSRIVKVTVSVQHEGESWNPPGFDVQYRGPPPPPPPPTPAPAESVGTPATGPQMPQEERPATANQPADGSGATGGSGGPGGGPAGGAGPGGGPVDPGSPAAPMHARSPAAGHASSSAPPAADVATRPVKAPRGNGASRPATARPRITPADAPAARLRAPALPLRAPAPPLRAPAMERGAEVPAIPLVGIALVILLGSAAVTLWFLRRTGGAPSGDRLPGPAPWIPPEVALEARARDILIDAELQEMIAEARARKPGVDREVTPLAPR